MKRIFENKSGKGLLALISGAVILTTVGTLFLNVRINKLEEATESYLEEISYASLEKKVEEARKEKETDILKSAMKGKSESDTDIISENKRTDSDKATTEKKSDTIIADKNAETGVDAGSFSYSSSGSSAEAKNGRTDAYKSEYSYKDGTDIISPSIMRDNTYKVNHENDLPDRADGDISKTELTADSAMKSEDESDKMTNNVQENRYTENSRETAYVTGITADYSGGVKESGDTVDNSEVEVVVNYSDGTKIPVNDWICDQTDNKLQEGENTYTVKFGGFETSFVVTANGAGKDFDAPDRVPVLSAEQYNYYSKNQCDAIRMSFLNILNEYRTEKGVGLLTLDECAQSVAIIRAQEATLKFSHERPDGSTGLNIFLQCGDYYKNTYRGENLAEFYYDDIADPNLIAGEIFLGYQNSASHNANMLGEHYTMVGIGLDVTYVTIDGWSGYQVVMANLFSN